MLIHLFLTVLQFRYGHPSVCGLVPMFNLDEEQNIPTFFSSTMLLICTGLLTVIAVFKTKEHAEFARHWTVLSILFLLLAIDEAGGLHEWMSFNIKRFVYTTGFFFYAWVIPGTLGLIAFTICYWNFLWHLPPATRWWSATAAVTYVAGALGCEFLGGRYFELHGRDNMPYALLVTYEEGLEMAGIVIFIGALLAYMSAAHYRVLLRFLDDADSPVDDQFS